MVLRIFSKLSLTTNTRNPNSDPKVLEPRPNPVLRYSEKDLPKSSTKSYRLSFFGCLISLVTEVSPRQRRPKVSRLGYL